MQTGRENVPRYVRSLGSNEAERSSKHRSLEAVFRQDTVQQGRLPTCFQGHSKPISGNNPGLVQDQLGKGRNGLERHARSESEAHTPTPIPDATRRRQARRDPTFSQEVLEEGGVWEGGMFTTRGGGGRGKVPLASPSEEEESGICLLFSPPRVFFFFGKP